MDLISRLRSFANGHSLALGLFLTSAYFLVFAIPEGFSSRSFGRGRGIEEATDAVAQLPLEIALVVSLFALIAALGWWRQSGWTGESKGGLWYIAPSILLSAIFLIFSVMIAREGNQTLLSLIPANTLLNLALMTLMVGLFEELLFRGIVQYGATKWAGEIGAVLITAVLFGLMHYVNYVNGQPLGVTHFQVLHAGSAGILYGALRLRTGLLWPSILVHAIWDYSVLQVHTVISEMGGVASGPSEQTASDGGAGVQLIVMGFEPLLGLFILWRWWVMKKRTANSEST